MDQPKFSWLVVFVFSAFIHGSKSVHKAPRLPQFDDKFMSLLENNKYESGSFGVMRNGKLVYAKGFSINDTSDGGNPLADSYSSSFSKLLTAAAIFKLEEARKLKVGRKVFCKGGILEVINPWKRNDFADKRICDITVDHLLHHSAGWDYQKPPLFDPLLNQFYVTSFKDGVLDLKSAMNQSVITPFHAMTFMLTRNLDFNPGTQSVYSNFAYSILGRVIEAASEMSYQQYVKKAILDSCGLWHTQLGPRHHKMHQNHKLDALSNDVYTALGQYVLDSALGWESNVFDILRLMRCLDGSGKSRLLSPRFERKFSQHMGTDTPQGDNSWYGAAFQVNRQGELWLKGDPETSDIVIFHSGLGHKSYGGKRNPKLSWVVKMEGNQKADILNQFKNFVKDVSKWPNQDLFLSDLTDFTYKKASEFPMVKLKLSEHHVKSFVNAARMQHLKINWFSAWSSGRKTWFTVIASPAPKRSNLDYIFESGLSKETLDRHRNKLNGLRYRVSFLQSYRSMSHDSIERYACIFERSPETDDVRMGLQLDHKHYKNVFSELVKEGFRPSVQSLSGEGRSMINYIFERNASLVNFKAYLGVKEDELNSKIRANAALHRELVYLDVIESHGRPSFSAIFKQARKVLRWTAHINLTEQALHQTILDMRKKKLYPRIIVALPPSKNGPVKFVAYFN